MTKLNYVIYPTYPKNSKRKPFVNYKSPFIRKRDFNEIVKNIKTNNAKSENKGLLCSDDYFEHHRNIVVDDVKYYD